jgi:hypothetical protein
LESAPRGSRVLPGGLVYCVVHYLPGDPLHQ